MCIEGELSIACSCPTEKLLERSLMADDPGQLEVLHFLVPLYLTHVSTHLLPFTNKVWAPIIFKAEEDVVTSQWWKWRLKCFLYLASPWRTEHF